MPQNWDSVCADCRAYQCGRCNEYGRTVSPDDCIAAVCRWFTTTEHKKQDVISKEDDTAEYDRSERSR